MGAGGTPLFLPTPDFMASAGTVSALRGVLLSFVFPLSFLCPSRSLFFRFYSLVRAASSWDRAVCTVRFLSAVRAVATRCKRPFALRPGLSQESVSSTKEMTKEKRKEKREREDK